MNLLTVRALNFVVGQFELKADFKLQQRVTGVFGPSGAGKTTLLELIAGLRTPKSGKITVREKVLYDSTERIALRPERRHVAYLPQDLALFPHMSVRQNLLYGARENENELAHVVSEFALDQLLERVPSKLSGGEKQRVAIGRALMTRPQLLLLDEPLSNLDRELKERGLELFRRVRDEFGTPIIYVAHDANEVVDLCDEVIVLRKGRIEKQGVPREIFRVSQKPNWELNGKQPQ